MASRTERAGGRGQEGGRAGAPAGGARRRWPTRFLSPVWHGYADFVLVPVFLFAPPVLGFTGTPRTLSWALGLVWFLLSLFTRFPVALVRAFPFRLHEALEGVLAPLLVLSPWLLGFPDVASARAFFVVVGLVLGALFLVTDYHASALVRDRIHDDREVRGGRRYA